MGWVLRALIAALLLGVVVVVGPGVETYAAAGILPDGSSVMRPAADNLDCPNSNPRKQKKCHYNNQDNYNDNMYDAANVATASGNGVVWSTDAIGASVQNGDLRVDLSRTAEKPVANAGFWISVTGSGAPISYIEWWADSPNPSGDDIGAMGRQHQDCGGAQPCTFSSAVVPRSTGWYVLHAMVVDTSGNVAGTNWQFLASENARS